MDFTCVTIHPATPTPNHKGGNLRMLNEDTRQGRSWPPCCVSFEPAGLRRTRQWRRRTSLLVFRYLSEKGQTRNETRGRIEKVSHKSQSANLQDLSAIWVPFHRLKSSRTQTHLITQTFLQNLPLRGCICTDFLCFSSNSSSRFAWVQNWTEATSDDMQQPQP